MKLWTGAFLKNVTQEYENIIFLNNNTDAPLNHCLGWVFLKTSNTL